MEAIPSSAPTDKEHSSPIGASLVFINFIGFGGALVGSSLLLA